MAVPSHHNLFLVLCTFAVLVTVSSSQQCTTNPDGEIVWGSLPTIGPPKSSLDYETDDQRRGTLSDMARGFVNLVTPPETVSEMLDYVSKTLEAVFNNNFVPDPWPMFQEIAALLVGIIVCLSVGLAYILLVLIIGPIFGCCRCCNNCGGKRVQAESGCPGCLRVFYTILLLCVTGVLCAGMAFTNFSNDFISYAYTTTESSAQAVIGDVQAFATDAVKQMEFVTDNEFGTVDCLIRRDIANIGDEIADPLLEYLKKDAGVQVAMDSFTDLTSDLNEVYMSLASINSSRTEVIDGTARVKGLLEGVKADLTALTCNSCPSYSDLDKVNDYSLLPDFSSQVEQASLAKNTAEVFYTDFNHTLNNISTLIDDSASSAVTEVEKLLNDTKQTVDSAFDSIVQQVAQVNQSLEEVKQDINNFFDTVNQYWDYRYYGLIAVTCLTLLIVLFNVIGIAMGTFAYKDVLPTERSRMSNAAGNVLIAGVFFSILFGLILMLICFLGFAVAGTATLSCEPLKTYEALEKTIDKPGFLGPGYFLGETLFGNSSVELTLSSILTECEQNEALYAAMDLSYLFSLDSFVDELNKGKDGVLDQLKNAIDIPTLDLVPDNLQNDLDSALNAINLGSIDPAAIETLMNSSVTVTNLKEFAEGLRNAASNPSNNATELNRLADEVDQIQAQVEGINAHKARIVENAYRLSDLNATLPGSITKTVAASQAAETKVNLPATEEKVQNITVDYVNQVFGYADQYVEKVGTQLNEDIAKCQPVWQIYHTAQSLACYYIFDSLNTLWFTTGWCAIFYIPSIFIAVRLAKYYRIMDEEAPPRTKRHKKGARRVNQDMAMEDLPDDGGHHTGHDNIRLVESLGQGGMQPQQNPHYIPDDQVINGYDGYNNLGRPMAPPPAYHPDPDWDMPKNRPYGMPSVDTDSYRYGYSQDPLQRQNQQSVVRDMREYNKKPRVATYL
ncbi:prominin-1-A-like isoform X2 [Acanthaster planci]|uniref:Prominin-1-A-like isoform X2 n=1 Tax=Acanthaster planci TaxID=133434 RepID=A0A8B7XL46_ACAPL|nr:prominin-1-A-like isoform X2 [Acanthaster planci]